MSLKVKASKVIIHFDSRHFCQQTSMANRHSDNRLYNMNHFHFSDQGMTTSWTAMVKDNREIRTSGVMFVLVSLVIIVSRSHC